MKPSLVCIHLFLFTVSFLGLKERWQRNVRVRTTTEDVYWTHFHTVNFCQFLTGDFHSRLMIPKKFADNTRGELQEKLRIKGPSGGSWEVALLKSDDGMLYFGDGWEDYVNDHALRQNDILVFKYTGNSRFDALMMNRRTLCEKEDSYFVRKCGHARSSVEIAQDEDNKELIESTRKKRPRREGAVEETANSAHDEDCDEGLDVKKPITQAEKMVVFLKVRKELTDESFIVVMHPTHVNKKFYLNVPAEWLTRHQIQRNQDVILRTKGSSWQSKLLFDGRGHGGIARGWREFARGWREFAMGNSLEEHDVCQFKLDGPKREPITLDVTIFKVVPGAVRIDPVEASTLRRLSMITSRSFS